MKLKEGMKIDYLKLDDDGSVIKQTLIVKSVPNGKGRITVIDDDKETKRLMNLHTKKHVFHKKESALKIALRILKREARPIHIDELIDLIFAEGYKLPRGGKTFKNTISTSLNKECSKENPQIKKTTSAVYADINVE